jgi:hypothetical protein
MKKLQVIVFCFCVFLFAQEDNSNKRRASFGFRQGGGIGLFAGYEFHLGSK